MNYFRAAPNAMRAQKEELETVYRALCEDMSELGGVIRRLGSMTGFDGPIKDLRCVQQKGSGQQIKLRQSAAALEKAAELYTQTELKNLDGSQAAFLTAPSRPLTPVWRAQAMLPDAESLLGMKLQK